ncbi:MAG: YihY/virulence factor BrkB family protein [Chloroflexota bacterium]|nr:YihY/virulence factor BrkB family protein [Chloroflexota bacterium]
MKLSQIEWKIVGKAVVKEYSKDDVPGLAAEMAYHFIFALFPFIIFLTTIAGIIGQALSQDRLIDQIMAALYSQLPAATVEALRQPLEEVLGQRSGEALSIGAVVGIVLALYSASNGVATIMKAFNRAYGVEETRGFIKTKALAIGLTLVLSLLLITGFISLTIGNDIVGWLADVLGLGGATAVLLTVAQYLLALVGITLAFGLLYWQGPNVDQQFRWLTPGSFLATAALVLLTILFGLYVNLIGASSYAKTYGTAFGLILFMLYLYLTSQVILLGAEFNAETAKRYDPDTIRDKITDPRKQLPGEQPAPHPQAAKEAGVSQRQVQSTNQQAAKKVAAGKGGPETATAGGRASSAGSAGKEGAAGTADADAPGTNGASSQSGSRATDGAARGESAASTNGSTGVAAPVENGASSTLEEDGKGHGITIADPQPGPNRTQLATLAVSGAAIAGAVALGLLRRDRHNGRGH